MAFISKLQILKLSCFVFLPFLQKYGKPKQGPVFDMKRRTNAAFKYAVRFIKNNENAMRANSLAKKMQEYKVDVFWKQVKQMNNKIARLHYRIIWRVLLEMRI